MVICSRLVTPKYFHKNERNNELIAGKGSDTFLFIFSCEAVDCGKLSPPMNGSSLGEETTYLKQVEISCDEGFNLRGLRLRKCQADGNWSGETSVCEGSTTF